MTNNELRSQKSEVRSQIVFVCVLSSVICLLFSAVMAASWIAEDVLHEFLAYNYPWEKIEISNVKIIGIMPDKAPDTITVERGPLGKGVFSFGFDNDKKVVVKADVRAFDRVVKSKWSFKKGYSLKMEDLYLSEMDVIKMPKSSVKDPETVTGKPLNRSVMANISLTEDMVERTQAVNKGKKVVLLINAQGLNISAAGETKERGYVGRPVKAINLSSKREVTGVLIDEKTVEVEL